MTDLMNPSTGEIPKVPGDVTQLLRPVAPPTPPADPEENTERLNPFDRRRPAADATGTRLYREHQQAPRTLGDLDAPGPECDEVDLYAPPLQAYAPDAVKPSRLRWPWRRSAAVAVAEYVGRHRAGEA